MNKPISLYKWLLVINADLMNNLKLIYLNILTDQAHTFPVKESAHLKHTRLDPDQICARMWKLFACDVYSACPQLFVWLKIAWVPMRLLPDFSYIWMLLPGQQSPPKRQRHRKKLKHQWHDCLLLLLCSRMSSVDVHPTQHVYMHPAAGQQTMFSIVALV